MPRVYGLSEIQRIVNNAYSRGHADASEKRESTIPSASEILDEIGIRHPMNREFKLGQAPSWAKKQP